MKNIRRTLPYFSRKKRGINCHGLVIGLKIIISYKLFLPDGSCHLIISDEKFEIYSSFLICSLYDIIIIVNCCERHVRYIIYYLCR